MKRNFLNQLATAIVIIVALVACRKNEDPGIRVTGVSLDNTSLMLTITETETLTATVIPDEATNKSVKKNVTLSHFIQ